jgi:(2Fe-2S) ferredoxin
MNDSNNLPAVAANLGIGKLTRHIFLCADATKPKCAGRELSNEVWEHLKKRVAESGLMAGDRCTYRTKANCLRVCESGPIAVVYPDGIWYHSVTKDVVDRIVDEHLAGGTPVSEYVFAVNPLNGTVA